LAQRIITLTSDFGINDHYVGAMKGVILSINPDAQIVDICNSVQSFDVFDGALTIAQAYEYFPPKTIHVVVVDPGVGTARRPILVSAGNHFFIAPDNGVLSLVYEREVERLTVRHITADHYFRNPVSPTFQGRDVFAAVAGNFSKGVQDIKFGEQITDFVRFGAPRPKPINERLIKGMVLKVDKFGNLITNITPKELPQLFQPAPPPFKLLIGKHEITKLHTAYAQGAPGEVFGVLGSLGYLEIVANRAAAASALGVGKGAEVSVMLGEAQASAG
jgi:S-adenosyl-L-methionine hydrolase (adenosine-forming)